MLADDEPFDSLFRQYEQAICSYLARLTGDPGCAQELAQETFLRAYRALARGERWDNPRAWLYRVASRLATDHYRRRKLLRWLPLGDRCPDPRPGIGESTAERLAVQAALVTLPPKYRVPLVLYTCEERSVAEIAETLGLSASAVKMRLSRAREKFRRAYQEGEDG
jgi:RNA polymerase sigma-70 factor (ECF subfamily)